MEAPPYDFDIVNKESFMYQWVQNYMEATDEAVRRSGVGLAGKTLYDLGVGRGRSLALFKAWGVKKVIGLDVDRNEVEYARKQGERLQYPLEVVVDSPRNDYLKGLPSESCESVTIMNALNFMPKDVRASVISEAKRILKPGGLLIVADATRPSLMWFFNSVSLMPRIFSSRSELEARLYPLRLIATCGSNYFYFFNKIADIPGKIFGVKAYRWLNAVFKAVGVPPSTQSFVFIR